MADLLDESGDRVVIELDPGSLVELTALTESFSGLSRFYERHFRQDREVAPKLFITRLETGSIVAEIVPLAVLFGGVVLTGMGTANTVAEFVRRLQAAIKSFADPSAAAADPALAVTMDRASDDDARDIKEFVRPLIGKKGAMLKIRQARFEALTKERRTVVEYIFDDAEINRAAVNIDAALSEVHDRIDALPGATALPRGHPRTEVMLFFEQASQKPGKATGRTADKGVIPDISPKALPIYFLQTFQHLKDQMIRRELNPFKSAFVVDVMVQSVNDQPQAYTITNVREIIPIDDDDRS